MKKFLILTATAIFLTMGAAAQASIVPFGGGLFQINYDFDLKAGTLHGSDITDILIFETDGTQLNIDSTFSAAGKGPSRLNHLISFEPTKSLVLGLDRAPSGSGLVDHLVVFMNNDFADFALTQEKFSTIFTAVDGRPRVGHNAVVSALKNAQLGDLTSRQLLSDFFTVDAGKYAAFNPENSFRVLEFSPPVAIDVIPEPASMILFGTGLAGAFFRRRLA